MEDNGQVDRTYRSRKLFHDDTLKYTLRYLFISTNIQLMAWGARWMKVNWEWKRFPLLRRKMAAENLWRRYSLDDDTFPEGCSKVKRTLFLDIVNALTKAEISQRTCIDYKLHVLVYENVNTLKRIA